MIKNKNPDRPADPSRRKLFKSAGLLGAVVASSTSPAQVIASDNPAPAAVFPEALEVLSAAEAETLEAMVERILPSDELGPGAKEARAAHFIDRSLAADNAASRPLYAIGLTLLNEYAQITYGADFHRLDAARQDAILGAVQNNEVPGFNPSGAGFFAMVRSHTIDGTFCDPYYGGNRNFVGWDMLGYPGIRLAVSESDMAQGENLASNHLSAYDSAMFTKNLAIASGGDSHGN
jgi:gluconate 2-dehydrogenase gamma chain